MSYLKQLIAELRTKHSQGADLGPYGGIAQLDVVDALKNDPKKVALPFTRYLMQRSSAEGEEESKEDCEVEVPSEEVPSEKGKTPQEVVDEIIAHADQDLHAEEEFDNIG